MSRESAPSSRHRPSAVSAAWGVRAWAALALILAWLIVIPAGLAHAQVDVGGEVTAATSQAPTESGDSHHVGGEAIHCAAHCAGHSAASPLTSMVGMSLGRSRTAYAPTLQVRATSRDDEPPTRPPAT